MSGYIVYWPKDQIKKLEQEKDAGPISVVFGSAHSRMPTIKSIKAGDTVFPVTLIDKVFYVVARLPVESIEPAYQYLIRELGNRCGALTPSEMDQNEYYDTSIKPHQCHQKPFNCCSETAAQGLHGSSIELRPIPKELIADMRFGPTPSKQRSLSLDKNGCPLVTSLTSTRKMSPETLAVFESLFS